MPLHGVAWFGCQDGIRKEDLAELLGLKDLPIILASEPLAKSCLSRAHRVDHRRSPQDTVARSRRSVWIPGAVRVAKRVASQCFACRLQDRKAAKQQMGQLPAERLGHLAPFEASALDLFGPFPVRDAANGRRTFKCWVVNYVCMATKAVALIVCPGYSTCVFMATHRFFTGIYGKPRLLYTDHAPSLMKAAETPDWAEIASEVGNQGTEWRLTAKGCSWRNGLAERVVRAARHTLHHELKRGVLMDIHDFGATLATVASIINSRPLTIHTSSEGEYYAISPRDILLGRANKSVDRATEALEFVLDQDDDEVLAGNGRGAGQDHGGMEKKVDLPRCFRTWWGAQSGDQQRGTSQWAT